MDEFFEAGQSDIDPYLIKALREEAASCRLFSGPDDILVLPYCAVV
jgi:hypothetical protein